MGDGDTEYGSQSRGFEALSNSIELYFNNNPVGPITETDLTTYGSERPRVALETSVRLSGLSSLPSGFRQEVHPESTIQGKQRSDNIIVFAEELPDGSRRTYNFYPDKAGPPDIKVSFYSFNMVQGGEQTNGIKTKDGVWHIRTMTKDDAVFYSRTTEA